AAGVAPGGDRQPAGRLPALLLPRLGGAAGAEPGGRTPALARRPARDRGQAGPGAHAGRAGRQARPASAEEAMNEVIDGRPRPAVLVVGRGAVRGGGRFAGGAWWFRLRPPRGVAVRSFLCRLLLVGGLLLPLLPSRWGPTRSPAPADPPVSERLPEPVTPPAV